MGYGRRKTSPSRGVAMLPIRVSVPSQMPMPSPMAPSTCASPMEATVSTRREDFSKRRMTRISVSAPETTPTTTPMAIDRK